MYQTRAYKRGIIVITKSQIHDIIASARINICHQHITAASFCDIVEHSLDPHYEVVTKVCIAVFKINFLWAVTLSIMGYFWHTHNIFWGSTMIFTVPYQFISYHSNRPLVTTMPPPPWVRGGGKRKTKRVLAWLAARGWMGPCESGQPAKWDKDIKQNWSDLRKCSFSLSPNRSWTDQITTQRKIIE